MLAETQITLTAAALEVLAVDQTQQTNAIGEDRITYFTKLAHATLEIDFRDAVRDYKASHKGDKVASVRASEFQALYYAIQQQAQLVEMGYHAAVEYSRRFLAARNLRTNGKPILSDEEKQANRDKNMKRKAATEAAKVIDFGQPDALIKLEQQIGVQLDQLRAEAEQKRLDALFSKVDDLVKSILAEGDQYALSVLAGLAKGLDIDMQLEMPDAAPEGVKLAA